MLIRKQIVFIVAVSDFYLFIVFFSTGEHWKYFFDQITSDDGKDLLMKSGKSARIQGNENVFVDSFELSLKAKNAITLSVGKDVSRFSPQRQNWFILWMKSMKTCNQYSDSSFSFA